ncbi:MAG: MFS transporter [Planctomycetota bacterium]|nr:MFS transporter [Planctomycetota bacterium]
MLAGLWRKLALDRPEARAWAWYDWANSAFFTVVATAVFPLYFNEVACKGLPEQVATRRLALVLGLSMVAVALVAPVAGALADFAGARKKLLGGFMGLGALATAGMFFVGTGDWLLASVLVGLANVGIVGSLVCYDALLPHVAPKGKVDQLSTTGYALGYLGGGLLLGLNLLWIWKPGWFGLPEGKGETLPVRLAFVSVAIWWVAFSIPLFLRVPEPPRVIEDDEETGASAIRTAFTRLGETLRELRGYKQAFLMLLAALVYGEGIGTIIKMSGSYAKDLGLSNTTIMLAFFCTQFIGIPFAIAFGRLAAKVGSRRAIYVSLAVYVLVLVYAFFLETERDFFVLAITVGMVQGGAQALSRSLFASMIPAHKSTEFFGFFAFASKLAGSIGPLTFFAVGTFLGSNRYAILSLVVFFVLGWFLLSRVNVEEGQRRAREAEKSLRATNQST